MIIYREESYKIVGAAFNVYNGLGPGFLEAVYQEALEIELQKQGIPYEREKELKIQYNGIELKQTYKADFVCYLHATGYKLGLLFNFGYADELEKERIVL